jgi:hypothetical protein
MPTTSSSDELDFHMRELRHDLESVRSELAALAPHIAAGDTPRVRAALVQICAGVEHDYAEHSAKALALARLAAPAPDPGAESDTASEERWAEVEKTIPGLEATSIMLTMLQSNVEQLTARLQEAIESVASAEMLRERKGAEICGVASLLERVHESLEKAVRSAFGAMRLTTCVDRILNLERYQVT